MNINTSARLDSLFSAYIYEIKKIKNKKYCTSRAQKNIIQQKFLGSYENTCLLETDYKF